MKLQIANYLIAIAFGFLLCYTLIGNKVRTETKILKGESTVQIDTVLVPKPYTKVITKEVTKFVPKQVIKLDTVYLVNTMNHYKDTISMEENYSIAYNAVTTGTLDYLTLSSIDNRPDKVITRTETIVKQPGGLFIGGTTNINFTSTLGAMYIKDRNMIGVSIGLNTTSFTTPSKYNVSYYRRLF